MKKHMSKMIFLTLSIIISVGFQSCDNKIHFEKSSVVPAAEGWIEINKDKNDNYKIELKVKRLAEPQRLTPPKSLYIVWVETEQNEAKNVGMLKTAGGVISKELTSTLNTITPYKPVSIFITAEDSANITNPGSNVVLKTSTIEK